MNTLHFGIIWDEYTPAVEGQLVRDIIAMSSTPQKVELICCAARAEADRVLNGFGIRRIPLDTLAIMWIVYQTQPEFLDAPDIAETVVRRDLVTRVVGPNIEERDNDPGYFLPYPGRIAPPRNLIMPSPYTRVTDPAVLFLWS